MPDRLRTSCTDLVIFSTCSESTRRALALVAEQRSVRLKTTIAEQESHWPFLGVVRRGRVFAIVGTPSGRNQILFEALETEVFGNIVLFDGGATIARFATLAEPADLIVFPRSDVLRAAEADSRFALALAAAAAQQVRTIAELVQAHVSKKIVARVAAALRPYAPIESGLCNRRPGQPSVPSIEAVGNGDGYGQGSRCPSGG